MLRVASRATAVRGFEPVQPMARYSCSICGAGASQRCFSLNVHTYGTPLVGYHESRYTYREAKPSPARDVKQHKPIIKRSRAKAQQEKLALPSGWVYGTNSGHGHIWKRPDYMKIICGGPHRCVDCRAAKNFYKKHPIN